MLMRFATSCGLLVALTATTVLAQPHPKKKPVRKPVVVRNITSEEGWKTDKWERDNLITHYCTLPLDMPTDSQVEADANPVYTYVEQMPLLNGQPLFPASVAALTHALAYPQTRRRARYSCSLSLPKRASLASYRLQRGCGLMWIRPWWPRPESYLPLRRANTVGGRYPYASCYLFPLWGNSRKAEVRSYSRGLRVAEATAPSGT
jgi:hypothetical protein